MHLRIQLTKTHAKKHNKRYPIKLQTLPLKSRHNATRNNPYRNIRRHIENKQFKRSNIKYDIIF